MAEAVAVAVKAAVGQRWAHHGVEAEAKEGVSVGLVRVHAREASA
jgi:hypothetical protein